MLVAKKKKKKTVMRNKTIDILILFFPEFGKKNYTIILNFNKERRRTDLLEIFFLAK